MKIDDDDELKVDTLTLNFFMNFIIVKSFEINLND